MAFSVNGELVTDEALREEERLIRPRLEQEMSDLPALELAERVRQWARENLIERITLRQEAQKDSEPVPAEAVEELFQQVRTQSPGQSGCVAPVSDEQLRSELEVRFKVERLLGKITAKVAAPKNKDISDYYVKHKDDFEQPEVVHAAHVVKNIDENTTEEEARAAIEDAQKQLQSGTPFAVVADQLSDCPGRGGDLGFFPRGEMVEEFEEIVFAMKPGEMSGIFRSPFGFHIATLMERKPAGTRPLDEVKQQISQQLAEEKRQKAIEQFLDRIMAAARIEEVQEVQA
ncbi:MAG: peptidylprolyl isomerase [Acidobacteria bacterium]|nr:peptidylprolyl isomerase [Acidobacteriota bacterium]